jgi:hypothetical protein
MSVEGNAVGYTHSPCLWLSQNYFSDGKRAMAWEGTPLGDSWIYRFVPAPVNLPSEESKTMSLLQSINHDDHVGPVAGVRCYGDTAEFAPTLEFLNLKRTKFVSFGLFCVGYPTDNTVISVPKDLIKHVAIRMVGKPRDASSLQFCINTMRSKVKDLAMPDAMKLECVIYGSALAFIYGIESELEAFNNLCKPKHVRLYKHLSSALKLEKLSCCFRSGIFWRCLRKGAKLEEMDNATVRAYEEDRSSVPSVTFDAKEAWPKGLPGIESNMDLAPMKKSARIDIPEENNKTYGPQMFPNAITFSNYLPVVPNPSLNNEIKALHNRALVDTESENLDLWERVKEHSRYLCHNFPKVQGTEKELFVRWNEHFDSVSRRDQQAKAFNELQEEGLVTRDFKQGMFVKRECTMKGGPNPEDFDPRSIQGCSDKMNAAFSPFIWHASKILAKEWNSENRICYTSGMSAEQIGGWRKQFDGDDVLIIECDESRYDAHQGDGCRENARIVKEKCGLKQYRQASLVEDRIKKVSGYSRNGIRYKVNGTMVSGRGDTSFSNTWNNGSKLDYILELYGFPEEKRMMLVNGDDSLVVVRNCGMTNSEINTLKQFIIDTNKQLGFKCKCKTSKNWAHVEYCSSLFWPVDGGYVLGPKIGRRLPKIGFGLNSLKLGEVKGMLLGLKKEAGYIPVLRKYADYCLAKLKTVNAKHYTDKRSCYKALATEEHNANEETAIFFAERYQYDPELIEDLFSQALSSADSITSCINFPELDHLTAIDL